MEPNNPLRGPRRALRRGDRHALRYGRDHLGRRISFRGVSEDAEILEIEAETEDDTEGQILDAAQFPHLLRDDMWTERSRPDGVSDVDETSLDGVDNGEASDSDDMIDPTYGSYTNRELLNQDTADPELLNQNGEYEFDSQQDTGNDDHMITFDPMLLGLKEINNLAHFSVSSHKPGNGVEELLLDDLNKYWQSDGPQPHLLTIHFLRRVEIRAIRFYVDYNQDESYTPTVVMLSAGTGHHDLIEFATLVMASPVGWQEVDLSAAGGGDDGQSLCCWIVQIKVKENHQNGKDTHIRGIKIYAIDENAPPADNALDELAKMKARTLQAMREDSMSADEFLYERPLAYPPEQLPGVPERTGSISQFMRDAEIR